MNTGSICPLPELIALKEAYRFRLVVEESVSFGVLGSRGAGVTDHFHVHPGKVDMIAASMANALASAGGFCCGSSEIVEHQRLSGQAYTFSASLPAMLTVAASEALLTIERRASELLGKLRDNRLLWRHGLAKIPDTKVTGDEESPIYHFRLAFPFPSRLKEEEALQEVVEAVGAVDAPLPSCGASRGRRKTNARAIPATRTRTHTHTRTHTLHRP